MASLAVACDRLPSAAFYRESGKIIEMQYSRARLEAQLKQARSTLAGWVNALDERGVAANLRRRDPKWRNLNARCTQLTVRLKAIDANTAVGDDLKLRKAQKAAEAEAQPAEEPKKAAKKAKGGGKQAAAETKKKPKAEKKPASEKGK